MLKKFIKKVTDGQDLTSEEMTEAMEIIMSGKTTDAQIAGFLIGLKMKGEASGEIIAAAKVMRSKATRVEVKKDIILDTCGSGGDGHGTINISTATAIVAAAAGITVAKHGNRSITSKSGSADILKELGVNIEAGPEKVAECINNAGVGFIFAPGYHKAMKYVMPARKELGVRTMFNILGPVVNPAMHTHHLMGVFSPELVDKIIEVFKGIGLKHALVVCGEGGLDEISLSGSTAVAELKGGKIEKYTVSPADFGLKEAPVEEIKGGDPAENAKILNSIFSGKEKGACYDVVVLNSGFGIYTGDGAGSPKEGIEKAKEIIDSGKAAAKLKELIECSN